MKLGEYVKFQKAMTDNEWQADKQESLEFAKVNGMRHREHNNCFTNGYWIGSKWRVKKFDDVQEGIVVGVRCIDITGSNAEYGWEFGKKKKVYLVAKNMNRFERVPEEFIIR